MKNVNDVEKMIEDIVSLGTGQIEINRFDKKWTFKILNSKEHTATLENSSDNDMVSRMFKMQAETMKEALVSINDEVLSQDDKNALFDRVNPFITSTLYRLYDVERAKKEKELEEKK